MYSKIPYLRFILWCIILAVLPVEMRAATAGEVVWTMVERIRALLEDDSLDEASRMRAVREQVDQCFSFYHITRRAVGRSWSKFSPLEQEQLTVAFGDLLFHTYYQRSSEAEGAKVVLVDELPLGKNAFEVRTKVVRPGGDIFVVYRLIAVQGQWCVYDVVIEGVSLVSNYRSQFADILRSGTPAALIKLVEKKNAALQNYGTSLGD